MSKENTMQAALDKARKRVAQIAERTTPSPETLISLADVEVRAEQARQQEIANLIAMLATPAANPYVGKAVSERLKTLTNLGN